MYKWAAELNKLSNNMDLSFESEVFCHQIHLKAKQASNEFYSRVSQSSPDEMLSC